MASFLADCGDPRSANTGLALEKEKSIADALYDPRTTHLQNDEYSLGQTEL